MSPLHVGICPGATQRRRAGQALRAAGDGCGTPHCREPPIARQAAGHRGRAGGVNGQGALVTSAVTPLLHRWHFYVTVLVENTHRGITAPIRWTACRRRTPSWRRARCGWRRRRISPRPSKVTACHVQQHVTCNGWRKRRQTSPRRACGRLAAGRAAVGRQPFQRRGLGNSVAHPKAGGAQQVN